MGHVHPVRDALGAAGPFGAGCESSSSAVEVAHISPQDTSTSDPAAPSDEAPGVEAYAPCESCLSGEQLDAHVSSAWEWYASVGSPRRWLAPLVGYSDAAFRQLAREAGAEMASTQMLDAGGWCRSASYRAQHALDSDSGPLIVQLGGSVPEHLRASAAHIAASHPRVCAVELNLGCPQRCARKTRMGAYLAEDVPNLRACVLALRAGVAEGNAARRAAGHAVRCAVLTKVRCFAELERTLAYARLLEALGSDLVTVHGRTRHWGGGRRTGANLARWEWIRAVKEAVRVPCVANGNIRHAADAAACLAATGCDGFMSGVGALKRPHAVFAPPGCPPPFPSRAHAAARYLDIAVARGELPRNAHVHLIGKLALVRLAPEAHSRDAAAAHSARRKALNALATLRSWAEPRASALQRDAAAALEQLCEQAASDTRGGGVEAGLLSDSSADEADDADDYPDHSKCALNASSGSGTGGGDLPQAGGGQLPNPMRSDGIDE